MNKLLLPLAMNIALGGLSQAAVAATSLSACTKIVTSGVYHLTKDLTVPDHSTCFVINASNVTLDLSGHVLAGSGQNGGAKGGCG